MAMNPWILLGITGAFLVGCTTSFIYGNSVGTDSERIKWKDKESKEIVAANARIMELTGIARLVESKNAEALNEISKDYQEKLNHVSVEKEKFIASVRNGTIKLRIPSNSKASGSSASTVTTSTSGCDGETTAELPTEVSEFLYGEATRADEITEQLNACQEIIIKDRETLNVPPTAAGST
jgi:hypothetical protein